MRLFKIEAIIEASDEKDAEDVAEAIGRAICPVPLDTPDHACPRGWITITTELDPEEAAEINNSPDFLNR